MQYPKILIFGHPFNKMHGGGITLTNLFKGWPSDRIAVVATGHLMFGLSTEVCKTYYQLGNDAFRWRFPLNLLQKKFSSGLIDAKELPVVSNGYSKSGIRYTLVNDYFYPTLEWLGLYHNASYIKITQDLKNWLNEFKPQVLYLLVSSRETILFAQQLSGYLNIPAVIHMMDDWPSTISKHGPFKRLWHARIDRELKQLFESTALHLSISEAMSDEYLKRYKKIFKPFHNPIDTRVWTIHSKKDYTIKDNCVKLLYSGRIGTGITKSLVEIAKVIDRISVNGFTLKFHIQSPSTTPDTIKSLLQFKCIVLNPVSDYTELPGIYSNADILVIANDFDDKGLTFLRYSMPTKASEYMVSGTPILIYSPAETAVSKFFTAHNCGYCVTEQNPVKLGEAIISLVSSEEYRKKLGSAANCTATELFDANIVRTEFQKLLVDIYMERHLSI